MPIAIVCKTCGKNLKVPDERAGKLAKCPGCLSTFTVPMAGGAAAPQAVLPGQPPVITKRESAGPAIAISWGTVILVLCLIAIPVILAAIYFGPIRVKHQWDAVANQARSDIEDVVVRGLQSYTSSSPMFDPKKDSFNAGVNDITIFFSPFVMSMPEAVDFKGMSTQGAFKGKYHPRTGEIEADVEVGGMTLPGLEKPVHKGEKTIHVTGRNKNGNLTVEVDGHNADIATASPKPAGDDAKQP